MIKSALKYRSSVQGSHKPHILKNRIPKVTFSNQRLTFQTEIQRVKKINIKSVIKPEAT